MSWPATDVRRAALRSRPGLALALAAVALAPVALFASGGTVVVLAVAAVALALDPAARRAAARAAASPTALLLALLLLWAALSAAWAPHPEQALALAGRLLLLFAAGLILVSAAAALDADEHAVALRGIALGGGLLLLLLAVEATTGAGLTRLLRGLDEAKLLARTHHAPLARAGTLLALLCWPALLALARITGRRLGALLALPPIVAVIAAMPVTAPGLALGLAGAAFLLVYLAPRAGLAVLFAAVALSLALAPLLAALLGATATVEAGPPHLPLSWQHRLEIWQVTAAQIAERPLFGWGLDAARALGQAARSAVVADTPLALHPHNLALQLWLELGAVGVGLALALVALLFRWLWRRAGDPAAVACAAAALTSYLVFAQVSRGAWQSWWLATAWLLAAFATAAAARRPG